MNDDLDTQELRRALAGEVARQHALAARADLWTILQQAATALGRALAEIFAQFEQLLRQFADALLPTLQRLVDMLSPVVEAYQRDQLYGDLLWLWVPVPLARLVAARWPRRWLPLLRP